jgi:3-oxoacyl-[acyl-carrier protein] reductase
MTMLPGGASGFGLAIVKRFISEGARVVVIDINKTAAQKLEDSNDNIIFLEGDIRIRQTWETALKSALEKFKRVDIVVNCAGTCQFFIYTA